MNDQTIASSILATVAGFRRKGTLESMLCWNAEELERLAMFAVSAKHELAVGAALPAPEPFNQKHLRPTMIVRGEEWDFLAWLRAPRDQGGYDGYAPDGELLRCADYIEKLEAAYGTERTMHNAWRKRAEEAEAREAAALPAEHAPPEPSDEVIEAAAMRVIGYWGVEEPMAHHLVEARKIARAVAETVLRGVYGGGSRPALAGRGPSITDYLAWLTEWDRAECERRAVGCVIAPDEVESLARFLAGRAALSETNQT